MNTSDKSKIEGLAILLAQIEQRVNQIPTTNQLPTDYLTRKQVKDLLHISIVTVDDWTQRGILKAYRLGNRIYFKREEIEAAMIQIPANKGVRQ
jgi:excisionase family DNA binding protein